MNKKDSLTRLGEIDGTAFENGYVRLVPQNATGSSLDLKDMSTSEKAVIQLYGWNNSDAQKWKLKPKKDGSFQIANKGTKD